MSNKLHTSKFRQSRSKIFKHYSRAKQFRPCSSAASYENLSYSSIPNLIQTALKQNNLCTQNNDQMGYTLHLSNNLKMNK